MNSVEPVTNVSRLRVCCVCCHGRRTTVRHLDYIFSKRTVYEGADGTDVDTGVWEMAEPHDHEFLSLDSQQFETDHDSGSSPFETLWTDFARSHPRLSPPRTPTRPLLRRAVSAGSSALKRKPNVELRALEHVSEYDSNLMCPICHVPFIDPVVLDCDHTFCAECFEEYRNGGPSTDRSKCPSCRSYHLGGSKKASRLIKNMCNEIQVRCPNKDCTAVVARGCVEQHATKECLEQLMPCSDPKCSKKTKRKNFVPEQCIHNTHIECECGASIRLGHGEWIKHKDQECPNTVNQAKNGAELPTSSSNELSITSDPTCPGAEYGCTETVTSETLDDHAKSCALARLAPHMKKQSLLLQSLSEQLTITKIRNEALETGFERLNELITNTIQPRLDSLTTSHRDDNASVSDIEEIPRHDLSVLPAHLRELTPSPTGPRQSPFPYLQHQTLQSDILPRLSSLESNFDTLQSHLSDLDARSSLALMNETLRIGEELAHLNGAMYSTRTQVQWLLNRERILGQREAMSAMGARGRVGAPASSQQPGNAPQNSTASADASASANAGANATASTAPQQHRPSLDRNMSSAWSTSQAGFGLGAGQTPGSGPSSAATSPMFGAARPSLRRASGGSSQERVKL